MIVSLIRSRLKPEARAEYIVAVRRLSELARTMPGYISHKGFIADDGEQVTVVEFAHEDGLNTWRRNLEHVAAKKLGRQKFYLEYRVQICALVSESTFKADATTKAPTTS